MRKRPCVLQECLLITGRCRVPVEGEEYHYYYDSEDVWMPYGSLSSQPGASNVTQAALRLTTL